MRPEGGKNLELIFERLFENAFEYEIGNALFGLEFFRNILEIGQLPVDKELRQKLIPWKNVAGLEVKAGGLLAVFGVEQKRTVAIATKKHSLPFLIRGGGLRLNNQHHFQSTKP